MLRLVYAGGETLLAGRVAPVVPELSSRYRCSLKDRWLGLSVLLSESQSF